MTLAHGAHAQHDSEFSAPAAGLVGMRHDRRIEQRRGFERVLLGEIRTDQALPRAAQAEAAVKPMGDQPEMVIQGVPQVAISVGEAGHRAGERSVHLVFGHRQNATYDGTGP